MKYYNVNFKFSNKVHNIIDLTVRRFGLNIICNILNLEKNYMQITIKSEYKGNLRTEAVHCKSGVRIITDAPVDNKGKGESFSPTDLVSAALGSCMVTILGIASETYGFSVDGLEWETTKIMSENPRRISEIIIKLNFHDNNYSDKQKKVIKHITQNCPVALSLHPDLKQTIIINFK